MLLGCTRVRSAHYEITNAAPVRPKRKTRFIVFILKKKPAYNIM